MPDLFIPRQRPAIEAEQAYAQMAFQAHCDRCRSCRHGGDAYCARGRALLTATAPGDPDVPGYLTDLAYPTL